MNFSIDVSLYKPNKIQAKYKYNTDYNFFTEEYNNRFNCPWENKLEINGEILGRISLNVSILIDTNKFKEKTIEEIIKKNFNYYENNRITVACKRIKKITVQISDKNMRELVSMYEYGQEYNVPNSVLPEVYEYVMKEELRGMVLPKSKKILVSVNTCDNTVKNKKDIFEKNYPEYAHLKWTLKGMVYYVISHEIAHFLIPITEGKEIFPLILGSRFAFENQFIAVPQGPELKNAWEDLRIKLTRKTDRDNLDKQLNKCKIWLESLPQNKEFLENIS